MIKSMKMLKSNFHVVKSRSDVFSIADKENRLVVFGGDSANEDDYNEEYINEVYNSWDGTLHLDSKYGYKINN